MENEQDTQKLREPKVEQSEPAKTIEVTFVRRESEGIHEMEPNLDEALFDQETGGESFDSSLDQTFLSKIKIS